MLDVLIIAQLTNLRGSEEMPSEWGAPREERTHAATDRMIRIMRMHHRVIEKRIDGLGIHHSQHRMLMRLSCMGRTASQKDIATALDVSPACVARTLKALSAAGLIEKAEGSDSRCREIAIRPAGQQLIDASVQTFQRTAAEMFSGIPDEDIDRLTDILGRIQENLTAMENRKE